MPFLAFPDLHEVYRSPTLFPFFANRVMSPKRPDFAEHLARLNLDADNPRDVSAMSLLARTGGVRATDAIEMFPRPTESTDGSYILPFFMHGVRHLDSAVQTRVLALETGDRLDLRPEGENPVDPQAMRLFSDDGVALGWVPRFLLEDIQRLRNAMTAARPIEVSVEQVNPPPAPLKQRVLCRLRADWPEGFTPFCSGVYQAINGAATDACLTGATGRRERDFPDPQRIDA